jgi:hypothetical protein
MRTLTLAALLVVSVAGVVEAQQGQARQRQMLQQQVMQRYMTSFRQQAGLSDEQFQQFRVTATNSTQRRREIQMRERELWQALEGQMRPGVAADADSLTVLMDGLIAVQQELLDLTRTEQQEYAGFLTPVQRAQLLIATRRLQNSIQQIMRRRLQNPVGQT